MTKLLVLALLEIKPMSGYDIKQMLQLSDAERWAGVLIGSIYNALKKLEQDGYIKVKEIAQTGHRQKAIYHITAEGQRYCRDLIVESLQNATVSYPTTLYAGLSFADRLSVEQARTALLEQKDRLETEFTALEEGLALKKSATGNVLPPMTELVFNHMFDVIALQQKFVDQALAIIK
ncbi:PadR family transcriptional regulator [Amphibacillus sediminis]|uniref:PadR family transcriptional regulator n=1 Tax=Amphibacillus sediminis TaxID=360185 RepID=UPI00082B0ED2|nr:PadR family transcriptional regulator [Amphibacillus sediminis]